MPGTTWGLAVMGYAVNPSEYVRQLGPDGSIIDMPRSGGFRVLIFSPTCGCRSSFTALSSENS
jgi:hypothetical protein